MASDECPFDFLIAGAGFAGCVLAERLASAGQRVLLIDRRSHIGGNAYDYVDEAGILVHKYGPHIFHTNSEAVFEYLSRFTSWNPYEHRVLASVDGQFVPVPINRTTVNRVLGTDLAEEQVEAYLKSIAEPRPAIRTSEDIVVSKVGRTLYEKIFRGYTRKQWGLDPSQLDATVAGRLPVRTNDDDRYFTDRFQAMPSEGYTAMFQRMVSHPLIQVDLGVDFRTVRGRGLARETIFTGPVDEYFDFRLGRLPYRSLQFEFETRPCESFQPVATVNYPNENDYTRITEFKKLMHQSGPLTTLVYEYPRSEGDPYYPVPRPENEALYRQYEQLASTTPHTHFVGRLGTYRYYNMDQVVAQSLARFAELEKNGFGLAYTQLAAAEV